VSPDSDFVAWKKTVRDLIQLWSHRGTQLSLRSRSDNIFRILKKQPRFLAKLHGRQAGRLGSADLDRPVRPSILPTQGLRLSAFHSSSQGTLVAQSTSARISSSKAPLKFKLSGMGNDESAPAHSDDDDGGSEGGGGGRLSGSSSSQGKQRAATASATPTADALKKNPFLNSKARKRWVANGARATNDLGCLHVSRME
jgi:hypothetical protein